MQDGGAGNQHVTKGFTPAQLGWQVGQLAIQFGVRAILRHRYTP
jgi:hypothetical protein